MTQIALFPMKYLNITQGMNMGTHLGTLAIDIAGKDTGTDNVFAPFDGVIKRKWANSNTVWLESLQPVLWASGVVDYMTVMFTHDNYIADLNIGQIIKQGQVFYQEGTAGIATGNHVHLEVGKGKLTGTGWFQNSKGIWTINNAVKPNEVLWLNGTIVINTGGYKWKEKGMILTKNDVAAAYALYGLKASEVSEQRYTYWTGREAHELYLSIAKELANQIKTLQARLAEKPKEIVITKEIPTIVDRIVEVEKIVEVKVPVEVIMGDEQRSAWDLIRTGIRKALGIN